MLNAKIFPRDITQPHITIRSIPRNMNRRLQVAITIYMSNAPIAAPKVSKDERSPSIFCCIST